MKLEMSATEFSAFTAALAMSEVTRLKGEHEQVVTDLNGQLNETRQERNEAWDQLDSARDTTRDLRSQERFLNDELTRVRAKVKALEAQVKDLTLQLPDRKERGFSEMFEHYNQGQKIFAIKRLREVTGAGLKEAKEAIEGSFSNGNEPELFALSSIFSNYASSTLERLVDYLRPYVRSTLTQGDLELILTGKFHKPKSQPAEQYPDIKF